MPQCAEKQQEAATTREAAGKLHLGKHQRLPDDDIRDALAKIPCSVPVLSCSTAGCLMLLRDATRCSCVLQVFPAPPGRSWPPRRLQLPLAPHCSPWLLLVRPGSSSWPLLVPPHSSCFLLESYCVLLVLPLGPSWSLLVPPGSSCNPTFVPLAPPDSVLVSQLVPRCAQRCNHFFSCW